jgi:hypothetical protein
MNLEMPFFTTPYFLYFVLYDYKNDKNLKKQSIRCSENIIHIFCIIFWDIFYVKNPIIFIIIPTGKKKFIKL